MTNRSLDDFVANVFKDGPLPAFEPNAWYNADGDSIEIILEPRPYVAEWLDPIFTLLLDREDHDRVVGIVIKQLKKNFDSEKIRIIDIKTGRATVEVLIASAMSLAYEPFASKPKQKTLPPEIYTTLANFGRREVKLENLEEVLI